MHAAGSSGWVLDQVVAYSAAHGLRTGDAHVLHHYNNAVVLLPAEGIVVRLVHGSTHVPRIATSQAVCRWLVDEQHFPATAPVPGSAPVILAGAMTASFWIYYPTPSQPPPVTSTDLAALLQRLHRLQEPPIDLPRWTPLGSLQRALADPQAQTALTAEERTWLDQTVRQVQDGLERLDWPLGWGLVHGDAWAGNLLWDNNYLGPALVRLGDWDNVCIGPREIDLIPTWHASLRYGKGPQWRQAFRDLYGCDLQAWPGFDQLFSMRDLVQLTGPIRRAGHGPRFASALRQRLDDIRAGNRSATWNAL